MPKDKTASHKKITEAAMKEFLENGFERASMKAVADSVGMTSAALYRHFAGKQDMFAALVQPVVDDVERWTAKHIQRSYAAVEDGTGSSLWKIDSDFHDTKLVLDVLYKNIDASKLLLFCADGTPYENYMHNRYEYTTDRMMEFMEKCRQNGVCVRNVSREQMHMLVSSYGDAMLRPIEHGCSREEAEDYLRLVIDFFTPGWRMVTGL